MTDSVVIDGTECSFPITLGDLSDDFGYTFSTVYISPEKDDKYTGVLTLSYKGRFIASGTFTSDSLEVNDSTIIDMLLFMSKTNKYLPQIMVGGIDIYNADVREMNRVYGYDSDEYGYTNFYTESSNGTYKINEQLGKRYCSAELF